MAYTFSERSPDGVNHNVVVLEPAQVPGLFLATIVPPCSSFGEKGDTQVSGGVQITCEAPAEPMHVAGDWDGTKIYRRETVSLRSIPGEALALDGVTQALRATITQHQQAA